MSEEDTRDVVPIERLKAVRAGHRSTVTKYVRESEHLIDEIRHDSEREVNVNRLQVIKDIMKRKLDVLADLNEKILDNCVLSDIEGEIEHADDINTTIMCTIRTIEAEMKLKPVSVVNSVHVTADSGLQQHSTQQEGNSSSSNNQGEVITVGQNMHGQVNGGLNQHEQVKPRLPKLTIDKFSGDVTKFQTFWDIFQASINNNQHMSSIDKFSHLKGLLEGRAARAIEGLSLTEGNYQAALDILQEQFGNTQLIISAHMDDLLKLPTCDNEQRLSQLRYVYDKVNVNIRGLEALGVTSEQYGSFLIPVIMSKLPHDICVQIARLTKEEVWKIDDILDILRSEIHAREMSNSVKARDRKLAESTKVIPAVRRNLPTSASTFTSNVQTRQANRDQGNLGNWIPHCAFCGEQHYSSSCDNVKNAQDRKQVLRKAQKCFLCFKTGHQAFRCSSGKCCKLCKKAHHHSVCEQNRTSPSQHSQPMDQRPDVENTIASTSTLKRGRSKVLLQTATAYVSSNNTNQPVKAKILFDNGSQRSYITISMAKKLKLKPMKTETLNLNTFGNDSFTRKRCDLVSFQIHNNEHDNKGTSVQALSHHSICSPLNNEVNIDHYEHLQGLELADTETRSSDNVDILIGSDFYWDFVNGDIIRGDSGPVAIYSKLGWILSGRVEGSMLKEEQAVTNLIIEESTYEDVQDGKGDKLVDELKRFWEVESLGIHDCASRENEQFLSDIRFDKGQNRFEISLPWNPNVDIEPCSSDSTYNMCHARLFQLRSRLRSHPDLFSDYNKIIEEQVSSGIIEEVPFAELRQREANFLPHHAVVKVDRKTTKLRIVFDGSAKDKYGVSLNDRLKTGPNLTPHIFKILLNFRTYQIGLTADVEKAFHQISINSDDRKKLRFLWFEDYNNAHNPKIKQYQFCRLVFGLTSSPAILNSIVQLHLEEFQTTHQGTVNLLKNSLYVDDLVAGANDQDEAVEVYKQADHIMKKGGFSFRKWRSNDQSVQQQFRDSEHVDREPDVKVLGIIWNTNEDKFSVDLKEVVEYGKRLPVTKRSILKLSAKIFDPLGLLSPFTVQFKVLFQQLCKEKVVWDEELEGWPSISTRFESDTADKELVKTPNESVHSLSAVTDHATVNLENIIDINRYSSKLKLLRITSLVMKFVALLRRSTKQVPIGADDMRSAELIWIRSIQLSSFRDQLQVLQQKGPRYTLQYKGMELFMKDEIIHCQGRINSANVAEHSKFPILLPRKHRFTTLVIEDIHQQSLHSGVRQTLDTVRQTFWILKGRAVVKKTLRKCYMCKRYEGRAYKSQNTPNLPEYRVSDSPPFSYTGVDYAGPIILRDHPKAYVCLFTCASTRAVHIELAPDLSTKSFLEAFRRFTARRGLPYKIVSDNAKNFKKGAVDIGKIVTASRTQNYLLTHKVDWEFIVERAPWWGGFWERMIQLLKRCLRKAVGRSSLTFEELRTLLVEIESTINNRPITYVCDDDSGLSHALTPSDLIYGRRVATTSNNSHCDLVSTHRALTKRLKYHYRLLTNFTNLWRREYLLGLREYNMHQTKHRSGDSHPSVGDIVIIKDEQSARCYWKLGKIVQLFMGRDGRYRAASIQVLTTTGSKKPNCIRRPLQQLVPLEVQAD